MASLEVSLGRSEQDWRRRDEVSNRIEGGQFQKEGPSRPGRNGSNTEARKVALGLVGTTRKVVKRR